MLISILKTFLLISIIVLLVNMVSVALPYSKCFNYVLIGSSVAFIIYILGFYKRKKKSNNCLLEKKFQWSKANQELSLKNFKDFNYQWTEFINKQNNGFLDDNEICLKSRKIEPLRNIIKSHSSLSFFSMALIGKWGSGKSSYLRTLENKLNNEYEIIKINVWQLENSENITNEIRKEFDNILFESNRVLWISQLIKRLFIRDYFSVLSKYTTKSEIKATFAFEPTINASQTDFNELLKEILGNKKVLLLIDELDRLESKDEIINIFKVIRYTASFDNVFVITALDMKQIENKFGEDIDYIHKIFNLKYLVPNIDKDELIEYIEKQMIPKFKKLSITDKELSILLHTPSRNIMGNSIIDILSSYREIKNVFNDTYSFIKYLKDDSLDWNEYISFEFIFVLNLIKAVNFEIYTQLILDKQLLKLYDQYEEKKEYTEESKYKNDEQLNKLIAEIKKFKLYTILDYSYIDNFQQYLDIYQQHKIYNYHVSQTKYNNYIDDITILEETFKSLTYDKNDKEKFLLNVLDKNQKDKANHSLILNKVIELMPEKYKILKKIATKDFVTEEIKSIFINLLEREEDIPFLFMKNLFEELSKSENNLDYALIKELITEYFNNLKMEDDKFNQYIYDLFNYSNKTNIFKIYKIVYEYFKGNIEIKKALLNTIYVKDIKKLIKEIGISLDEFIDDENEYTVWVEYGNNKSDCQTFNGKELKEEI